MPAGSRGGSTTSDCGSLAPCSGADCIALSNRFQNLGCRGAIVALERLQRLLDVASERRLRDAPVFIRRIAANFRNIDMRAGHKAESVGLIEQKTRQILSAKAIHSPTAVPCGIRGGDSPSFLPNHRPWQVAMVSCSERGTPRQRGFPI